MLLLSVDIGSIFALEKILLYLINFVILFLGMTFLIYKPVKKFIKNRQETISSQIEEANKKSEEAESIKNEYSKLIAEADKEIERKLEEADKTINEKAEIVLNDAYTQADEIKRQAEQEVQAEKERALGEFKEEIADIAVNMASDILSREITAKDNAKIIDDCLKEWSERND